MKNETFTFGSEPFEEWLAQHPDVKKLSISSTKTPVNAFGIKLGIVLPPCLKNEYEKPSILNFKNPASLVPSILLRFLLKAQLLHLPLIHF